MKQIVKSQPARKKLWWLAVLGPLLYVIVDGWIYPIDERALLERTSYEEVQPEMAEEAMEMEDADESPPSGDVYPDGHTHTGWDIYDQIFERIKKAWPLIFSVLALKYGRKYVGDPK